MLRFKDYILCLLSLHLHENGFPESSVITYRASSGLLCGACRPGTHLVAECTETSLTQCEPCIPQLNFAAQYNAATYCQPCSDGCHGFMEETAENCTVDHDIVCGCVEGYYREQSARICVKLKDCGLGYGVVFEGSRTSDTKCEKCPHGFFSDTASRKQGCRRHTNCTSQGLAVIRRGTRFTDTKCGPCPADKNVTNAIIDITTIGGILTTMHPVFGTDTVWHNNTNFTTSSVIEEPWASALGGVGGGVCIIVIVFACCCWCRHYRSREMEKDRLPLTTPKTADNRSPLNGDTVKQPDAVHAQKSVRWKKETTHKHATSVNNNTVNSVVDTRGGDNTREVAGDNGDTVIEMPSTPLVEPQGIVGSSGGILRKRNSDLKGGIMKEVFIHLSNNLGAKWKMFLRVIIGGLNDADIEALEEDYPNNLVERAYQGMRLWYRRNPEADLGALVIALENDVVKKKDLADYIKEKYSLTGYLSSIEVE